MRKRRWKKGYEGFAWGCGIAAAAWCAATLWGCQLHAHFGEKHYCGNAETLRRENAESGEPSIEANPGGEPGIEIVMPGKRD